MKKTPQNPSEEINALLGGGTEFEGKLSFEGAVRIDGKFTGQIRGEGTIIIGEKGKVQAEIEAGVVMVRGEVRGIIHAKNRIEAYAPAKIFGDLHAPVLVFGEGLIFEGTSHMTGDLEKEDRNMAPSPP
ncbi:MAG: bactofilin family protein [Planctomycetaceae bacterium]